MESGVVDSSLAEARRNLFETYLELGACCPDACVSRSPSFALCRSTFDHPICNFAIDLNLDADSAKALADVARQHRNLVVYYTSGDDLAESDRLLRRAGFKPSRRLALMEAISSNTSTSIKEAIGGQAREAVARFMVSEFFPKLNERFTQGIVEATVRSHHMRLFSHSVECRVVGAAAISEQGPDVGLYNVCVEKRFRRAGLGSKMVREAVALCNQHGKAVSLQCDPSLESWYRLLGFRVIGDLIAYRLAR